MTCLDVSCVAVSSPVLDFSSVYFTEKEYTTEKSCLDEIELPLPDSEIVQPASSPEEQSGTEMLSVEQSPNLPLSALSTI